MEMDSATRTRPWDGPGRPPPWETRGTQPTPDEARSMPWQPELLLFSRPGELSLKSDISMNHSGRNNALSPKPSFPVASTTRTTRIFPWLPSNARDARCHSVTGNLPDDPGSPQICTNRPDWKQLAKAAVVRACRAPGCPRWLTKVMATSSPRAAGEEPDNFLQQVPPSYWTFLLARGALSVSCIRRLEMPWSSAVSDASHSVFAVLMVSVKPRGLDYQYNNI